MIVGFFQISFCIIQLHKANFYLALSRNQWHESFLLNIIYSSITTSYTKIQKVKQDKTKRQLYKLTIEEKHWTKYLWRSGLVYGKLYVTI